MVMMVNACKVECRASRTGVLTDATKNCVQIGGRGVGRGGCQALRLDAPDGAPLTLMQTETSACNEY